MTVITIFGSTGDLMYNKLIPALNTLKKTNKLPEKSKILCVGRRDWDTKRYLESVKQMVPKDKYREIEPLIKYVKVTLDTFEGYQGLKEEIKSVNAKDKIFYLALPPSLFPKVAGGLSENGLIEKGDAFARIVFEKPFGEDLKSARSINRTLWDYFDESQIYRIDHYLGKEMIQNILTLRFANRIFETDWNKDSIEKVSIIVKEKNGIDQRGTYYDSIGALRDMVQSHLLQMLALVAMEAPKAYDSELIRKEKVSILRKLFVEKGDVFNAQYKGYSGEPKVRDNSKTETFVHIKAQIDDSKWRDVPFYLMTGKKLKEKSSVIIIDFKPLDEALALWPKTPFENNQLVIKVAPDEGVSFKMNVKKSGLSSEIIPSLMDYSHGKDSFGNVPEAYEKLLSEIIEKNTLLFTRWDEIETTWKFIDKVTNQCLPTPYVYESEEDLVKTMKERGIDYDS